MRIIERMRVKKRTNFMCFVFKKIRENEEILRIPTRNEILYTKKKRP